MSAILPDLGSPQRTAKAAAFDAERLRRDFPILEETAHGKPLVYLDNAATTQKPRAVLQAIKHYFEHDNANVHRAVHVLSERATEAFEQARIRVQKFLGAGCLREIIFTRGATEAINLVAHSYGKRFVHEGDEILVTWMEHHSNIVPWQMLCQERGARLRVVPIDERGELRLDELEKLLTPKTKLLALAHVSNALGTINPVKHIIELAHRQRIPVLIDGAQAVSHMPVNVEELDCDFYVMSGHKIYGPTGIGALYGKPRWLELMPPYQGGGDMIRSVRFEETTYNELPYKFEAGTPHIAGAIGLAAALDYVDAIGLDAIAAHEDQLLRHATERLHDMPGVRLIGTARDKAAVLSFVVDDPPLASLDVGTRLDLEGVAIRTGHHCCQPLMDRYGIPGTARASFALYNTMADVDVFVEALGKIVAQARVARAGAPQAGKVTYPGPFAPTPQAAAEELAENFELFDDWNERYQYLIDLGAKLPFMPDELRTEDRRVKGCQSTVFLDARLRPATAHTVEFLADSDADIVRGELAVLQRLYSGQPAQAILDFDIQGFLRRIGLDKHLTLGRRNGLGEMVQRIRAFAGRASKRPD